MTEKLYWSNPLAMSFEIGEGGALLTTIGGKPSIVLPRTLFYPEGGGQLGDTGTLRIGDLVLHVADTQVDPEGAIHHVLDVAAHPASGAPAWSPELEETLRSARERVVRGDVDEARRRDHMVHHTAQHALSRALSDAARADTVSVRLGATACTIDVARPGLSDADLHRAEDLVNAIVMSDVAVDAKFPSPQELAELDLRKQPNAEKSKGGVRVIAIEGFDVTPCGGTHCTRSGQIGQIRIVGTEKYKGMLRITFQAGLRALNDARAKQDVLAKAAADLTCGVFDIPSAVTKLRSDLKSARTDLDAARTELTGFLAAELLRSLPEGAGPHVLTVLRPNADLGALRLLAQSLAEDPRVVALCASEDASSGDLALVVQRGKETGFDCGAFVLSQSRARGGRGGGRPERAEGRFPRETSMDALAEAARQALVPSA